MFFIGVEPYTAVEGESDRRVISDTNINCTRVTVKKPHICEHIHTYCVLYCCCISLFHFSTVEPQLSDPLGRVSIKSDNRKVG